MESSEMVTHLRDLSEHMALDAARDLVAPVEHCPGWTVADLVRHIGDVQWFWSEIVERRVQDRAEMADVPRPSASDKEDPLAYFRSNTARLCEALGSVGDDLTMWTWHEPLQNAWFVKRRQLIEVAIHGWDARNAVGDPRPILHDVAVLGIHEFVEVMTGDLHDDHPTPPPLHLSVSDADFTATMFASHDGHALTLPGPASGMLLTLWGRTRPGDDAVATALAAIDLS